MRRLSFPARPGALYHRVILPGGQVDITVYPLLFGGARICVGPCGQFEDGGFNRYWEYADADEAVRLAHGWDGVGSPPGPWRRTSNGFVWHRPGTFIPPAGL